MKAIVVKIRPQQRDKLRTVVVLNGHVIRYENKYFRFADSSLGFKFKKLRDAVRWIEELSKRYKL